MEAVETTEERAGTVARVACPGGSFGWLASGGECPERKWADVAGEYV